MREINLEGLDVTAYYEKLDNGLEVFYIPYKDKKNYYMSYATKFGSEDITFTPSGSSKKVTMPTGVAHFLEHKMFEQENGVDPFSYYAESGTGANASTSFNNTQYICYGTRNFEDNLEYLIKYVNSPYYTDENVLKEKGIITEELKMYADIPDWKIETRIRENTYKIHPRRIDIGGSIEDIKKITKEDLYLCYNNFYIPNNMFILLVGSFDKNKASKLINKALKNKESKDIAVVSSVKESKAVKKCEDTFYEDIKVPKIAYSLKVPTKNLSSYDDLTLDLYLSMLTGILFGSSSLFRERVRNKKILNSIYSEWETITNFRTFFLVSSTNNPDELIKEVKWTFDNIVILKEDFERMKKVWIANEVKMIDYVDATVRNSYDDIIRYGKLIPNKVEQIRNLSLEELEKIIKLIDFKNCAVVKMLPKEK